LILIWWTHLAYLGEPSTVYPFGATAPASRSYRRH